MRQFQTPIILLCLFFISSGCNEIRTLRSLRRVPDTNAFVMDYYLDYHIDDIRHHGMDVNNIEDTYMAAMLPDIFLPLARWIRRGYIPKSYKTIDNLGHHCSTVAVRSNDGTVYFGRNHDFENDACLILRVHDKHGVASLSVIDLAYLNLNRPDLDRVNLFRRIPLLFSPYFACDGMNRYGVAVSIMSVKNAKAPESPDKPNIINVTLMRLILDYAHNVDEAIDLIREFNVHFVEAPQHIMIADSSGRSCVAEYINGEICITPAKQPWQVCTNYIMWNKSEAENDNRCRRYRVGSDKVEALAGEIDGSDIHDITRSMSGKWTMWTSLYNLTTREAHIIYRSTLDSAYNVSLNKGSTK